MMGYSILYLGLDIFPIKLDFKTGLNNTNYTDGLLVANNYYNNILEKKNKTEISDIINLENEHNKYSNLLETKNNYRNLKKGNIICSIDDYKINSDGDIIISEFINKKNNKKLKLIPFKSYIWLFKNLLNNTINLTNISPNNYRGDLTKKLLNDNDTITINDSIIKKKLVIIESIVKITSNYESISLLGLTELKYISYNSIRLVELNEKMLEILKEFIGLNQSKYSNIINFIFENKYTFVDKKKMLLIDFDKRLPMIKIISRNINNFDDLIFKYKTKNEQKDFLLSQL